MPSHVTQIKVTGNVTEALAALDRLGIRAAEVGKETEDRLGNAGEHVGGVFGKLGNTLGNWGIPFSGSLTKVGEKLAELKAHGASTGAKLAEVGKVVATAGAAGFAVVGAESIKMAANFQSAAEHLVTDAGESQAALKGVETGMLNISAATGTSAADITNGMYHIESAGFHGAAGLQLLKVAAEGAKVGGANLDTVSKTLTGTMNSFHLPASQAVNVMNELIATVGSGDMRMEDLASSLGNVAPLAAKAGISLAQVGGAIATMTAQNMSAQQATQDLANTIRGLQNPTNVAVNEMAQFHINANTVSKNLGRKGLTGTLQELTTAILSKMGPSGMVLLKAFNQSTGAAGDLRKELAIMPSGLRKVAEQFESGKLTVKDWRNAIKALPADQQAMATGFISTYNQAHKFNSLLTSGSPAAQTYNAALAKMTGGATGLTTTLMLTGGSLATFQHNAANVAEAAKKGGKSVDNWNAIQGTFSQQMDRVKVTVQDLGIKLGLVLIPKVQAVARAMMTAVAWFEKHTTVAKALAAVIGGVLSAAVGAFVVNRIAKLVKSVAGAIKTLGEFGGTLLKLGKNFVEVGGKVASFVSQYAQQIGQLIVRGAEWVAAHAVQTAIIIGQNIAQAASATAAFIAENAATLGIIAGIAALVAAAIWLGTHWKEVWNFIKHAAEAVWNDGLKPVFDAIKSVVATVVDWVKAHWKILAVALAVILGPIGLIGAAIYELYQHWQSVWGFIKSVLQDGWNFIKQVFGWWETIAIDPIISLVGTLGSVWGKIWGGIKTAVSEAWKFIKPIFDAIVGAINEIIGLWGKVANFIGSIPGLFTGNGPAKGGNGDYTIQGGAAGLSKSLNGLPNLSGLGNLQNLSNLSKLNLSGHAFGGMVSDGWFMTGELGPEVGYKSGSQVQMFPNGSPTTTQMLNGPRGGGVNIGTIVMNGLTPDPNQIANELGWQLRPYLSSAG